MTAISDDEAYRSKISAELEFYADPENVDDLPPIYGPWSERYCLPLIREVGFDGLNEFFDQHVTEQCARRAPEPARLVSLGSGAGETEIGIADRLSKQGIENLEITLLELNPQLLDLAMSDAARRGLSDRVNGAHVDLNNWSAGRQADIYFANHSLHHIVELESLFSEVSASLDPAGILLVNDMIGRNGHVRWPEAAELVNRIWEKIPPRYRFNRFQQCVDDVYPDLDCSAEHFEGVRAQDILPLLLDRFHPDVYVTFASVIDPFVDRIYGPNFDIDNPEDMTFIDSVGQLDDAAIDLQLVTPTHLIASFRTQPVDCRYPRERSPQRTLRNRETASVVSQVASITDEGAFYDAANHSTPPDLEPLQRSLEEGWGRYHHLRQRKAVRAALALAALRGRLSTILRRESAGG
jgi:SAM-dependent methyltransferase